jgi:hypothetical protein
MCHEWWTRRERRRREERFDEELRYLLDRELERPEPPMPVVKAEADEEPLPDAVEVGPRS